MHSSIGESRLFTEDNGCRYADFLQNGYVTKETNISIKKRMVDIIVSSWNK